MRDDYAGKYNPASLVNLSKLYWRLGAFDANDDMAIANYVKINDCKIYTDYLHDDLEWSEIVKTMKKHLSGVRDHFPTNFQFVLNLHLGRYDPATGGFPIVDRTGFKDARRITVGSLDQNQEICFDSKEIKDYPKSVVIILAKPFTLDFLKLDEHVAQAYILRKQSEYSQLSDEAKVKHYEREAYLRLRVSFYQYDGNMTGDNRTTNAIVYAILDGYEVFEDPEQKRLMASVVLRKADAPATGTEKTQTKTVTTTVTPAPQPVVAPASSPAQPVPSASP